MTFVYRMYTTIMLWQIKHNIQSHNMRISNYHLFQIHLSFIIIIIKFISCHELKANRLLLNNSGILGVVL